MTTGKVFFTLSFLKNNETPAPSPEGARAGGRLGVRFRCFRFDASGEARENEGLASCRARLKKPTAAGRSRSQPPRARAPLAGQSGLDPAARSGLPPVCVQPPHALTPSPCLWRWHGGPVLIACHCRTSKTKGAQTRDGTDEEEATTRTTTTRVSKRFFWFRQESFFGVGVSAGRERRRIEGVGHARERSCV